MEDALTTCQNGKATSKRRLCARATRYECARPGFSSAGASRAGAYKAQISIFDLAGSAGFARFPALPVGAEPFEGSAISDHDVCDVCGSKTWHEGHFFAGRLWCSACWSGRTPPTAGNPIEQLSKVMGHSSVVVTERYAHLKPDLFSEKVFDAISVDLSQPKGNVVSLPVVSADSVQLEATMRTAREDAQERKLA